MNAIVEQALSLWGMEPARYELAAARENSVFKVENGLVSFALRLHRRGYRTDAELHSELDWMEALATGGLSVPKPVESKNGQMLEIVDNVQVDMLTWLSGRPLGGGNAPLNVPDREDLFHKIGQKMAQLHILSDRWERPPGFVRCSWDADGLLGETPLWGRFWDNPALSEDDRQLFLEVRNKARAALARVGENLDFGLIHADLVRENIMIDGENLHLIDFDDGGFGYRIFEVATTLLKAQNEPDYLRLRDALLTGYTKTRSLDFTHLDLFIVLRAATYVGWNITRMTDPLSVHRNARFIEAARSRALQYL